MKPSSDWRQEAARPKGLGHLLAECAAKLKFGPTVFQAFLKDQIN